MDSALFAMDEPDLGDPIDDLGARSGKCPTVGKVKFSELRTAPNENSKATHTGEACRSAQSIAVPNGWLDGKPRDTAPRFCSDRRVFSAKARVRRIFKKVALSRNFSPEVRQ